MASFTDRPAQFNPYVQQLPVEAMVAVGTEKQRRYDEGVQRIQESIDRVMELDIVKDSHKQYLQQKLDSLGTSLRGVAAGDFSNMQLTKTVTGMATRLGKDPVVQNAVMSTALYRKERAMMDKDREEGKLNPNNEMYFLKRVNQWMQDPDLETSFNARYIPYTDIDKKMADVINTLKPDNYTTSQVFITDDNGIPVKDKNGNYVYSPVMAELKQKGLFPQKVEQAINQVLSDGSVQQQIQINAEANFASYTPGDLVAQLELSRGDIEADLKRGLESLAAQRAATSDPEKIKEIDQQVNSIKETMVRTDSQFEELYRNAINNPDAIKGMLEKNRVKSAWKVMHTYLEEERSYKVSPYWETNFRMQQEANDMRIKEAELALRQADLGLKQREVGLKEYELQMKYGGAGNQPTIDAMSSDMDPVTTFDDNHKKVVRTWERVTDEFIIDTYIGPEKVDEYMQVMRRNGLGKNMTRESAAKGLIEAWARNNGKSPEEYRTILMTMAEKRLNQGGGMSKQQLARKASIENAKRNMQMSIIMKEQVDAVAPLSANPTKEELERRKEYLQNNIYLNPNLAIPVITGNSERDKLVREKIATLIGSYAQAQNMGKDFKDNVATMMSMVKGDGTDGDEGAIKLSGSKDANGQVTHKLVFYDNNGKDMEMEITAEEARSLGINTSGWWTRQVVRDAMQLMSFYGNGSTSRGNPDKEETYTNNDAVMLKSDFYHLRSTPYDVKGNIKRMTITHRGGEEQEVFVPMLYVHDGHKARVHDLEAQASMDSALQKLEGLGPKEINQFLIDYK